MQATDPAQYKAAQLQALLAYLFSARGGADGRLTPQERAVVDAILASGRGQAEEAPRSYGAEWQEEQHPRDEGGRFASAGSGRTTDSDGPGGGDPMGGDWTFADSLRGVAPADLSAPVVGYRLQDGAKEMPRESSSHWTGDEGNTMGGSSAYANAANVVGDMLFAQEESVTGENYTRNIEGEGGTPQLWLLASEEEVQDAPGAELVIPEARPVGKFSKRQVWEALKEVMADDFPGVSDYEEPGEAWAIEADLNNFEDEFPKWYHYADDAVELLRDRLREEAGHA